MPLFTSLAENHTYDIGELAFSTYLMARDLGKPITALPVFASRFFPHTGVWVNRSAQGIESPADLVGRRVVCGSFGTNYSVWWRGAMSHQYDVPIQQVQWLESADEHLADFRPPRRFMVERLAGKSEPVDALMEGKAEAASLPGPARGSDPEKIRPLFADPYREMAAFAERTGCFPINTVLTVRQDAVTRNPDMPRQVYEAFLKAQTLYENEISAGKQDIHMGLSLSQLTQTTGLKLPPHGMGANRDCLRTMIAYCYEQGIIRKLVEPEDVFLLADS
jgi:4,5-dihydroxyphthalate decarboxylase